MAAQHQGWAYGERIPETSPWLTIFGSAYQAPELHATEAQARAALDARPDLRDAPHLRMTVAHVTEVWHPGVTGPRGCAYRITAAAEPGITGPRTAWRYARRRAPRARTSKNNAARESSDEQAR